MGKAVLEIALDAREDDIFPASLQAMTVTNKNFQFANGKDTSARTVVRFKKNKCDYSLSYSWRLTP